MAITDSIALSNVHVAFLPYSFLYANDCIVTKNGEMIMTIKVEPFYSNDSIRSAILSLFNTYKTGDVAFWIHTIRRKANVLDDNSFETDIKFLKELNDNYFQKNSFEVGYNTEIYISIVTKRFGYLKSFTRRLKNAFFFRSISKLYIMHFSTHYKKLKDIALEFQKLLSNFNSSILTVDGMNKGGILTFFKSILNLDFDSDVPISAEDLSFYLLKGIKIAFGNNVLQIRDDGLKRSLYVASLKIKAFRYPSISTSMMKILDLKQDYICTEILTFGDKISGHAFDTQLSFLNMSEDEDLKKELGFDVYENVGEKNKFCHQNIFFLIFSSELKELDSKVESVVKILSDAGFISIRHDIFLQNSFWSTFPGNFSYIPKVNLNLINNCAALTDLNKDLTGRKRNLAWEYPIAVFKTLHKKLFFFNFHCDLDGNVHTVISGNKYYGKTQLRNYLLLQSLRLGARIAVIERFYESIVMSKVINGNYCQIEGLENPGSSYCNPFSYNIDKNIDFHITHLIEISGNKIGQERALEIIKEIKKNFGVENIQVSVIKEFFLKIPELKSYVESKYFDDFYGEENIDWNSHKLFIGIEKFIKIPETKIYRSVLMHYVVRRIIESINSRTVFVLPGVSLVSYYTPLEMDALFCSLKNKDCVLVLLFDDVSEFKDKEKMSVIDKYIGTIIFFVGGIDLYKAADIGINSSDLEMIENLAIYDQSFFIKQSGRADVVHFDFALLKEHFILSSNKKTYDIYKKSLEESTVKGEDWLNIYYRKCEEESSKSVIAGEFY